MASSTTSPTATPSVSPAKDGAKPAAGTAKASGPVKKARKPYTISRQREIWTAAEHELFLDALKKYGRSWKQIEGHVRTKNVIQIRSHAQKYFLKLQKNNACEAVPPPRPKRRSAPSPSASASAAAEAASGAAPSSPADPAAAAAAAAAAAYSLQQQQQATSHLPFQQHSLLAGIAGLTPAQRQQLAFGAGAQTPAQQQQFAAAVQQHMQMFQFGSLQNPPAAAPFYQQHAMHPSTTAAAAAAVAAALNQSGPGRPGAPRPSAAKAISPRLPNASQSGTLQHGAPQLRGPPPKPLGPHASYAMIPPPATHGLSSSSAPLYPYNASTPPMQQTQQGQLFLQQQALHYHQRQVQLQQMQGGLGSVVSDGSQAGSASGTHLGSTPSGSGSLPTMTAPSSSAPHRAESVPTDSSAGATAAAVAAAAAAASGGIPGPGPSSPNFNRIYGFFATLFNPLETRKLDDVVGSLESSTLDCEIVKLLVRNLEVNLSTPSFRDQLSQTYRDQQATQQQQFLQAQQANMHDNQQFAPMDQNDDSLAWLSGTVSGDGSQGRP